MVPVLVDMALLRPVNKGLVAILKGPVIYTVGPESPRELFSDP